MNKRGITLIELIAVLALMALILGLIFPNVNRIINNSKNSTGNVQNQSIIEAAKQYLMDHIDEDINFDTNQSVDVTLKTLVENGYLTNNPKDSKTGKKYNQFTSKVTITKENNTYKYTLTLNT